mmetsp:Transcript_42934/g.121399  ORF Transcript_42934/g.121399 Transcript_42934/m.121399 type:complete len:455 (+) Transcript_42934:64-1428(+)
MATEWTVLVFGDSWADYMHPCWPAVLGGRLRARVFNFANAGSLVGDLNAQGQRALMSPQVPKAAGGLLKKQTLVVIHTCGNDFIMKMAEVLMGGGGLMSMLGGGGPAMPSGPTPEVLRANPGARESETLRQFMETMYRGGARHFLVSGVPAYLEMPIWNMIWPVIGGMVNSGKLSDLGVGPGDPPKLAMEVQAAALHERWESMVEAFSKAHADAEAVFFDEVGALERLRKKIGAATFDRSMWDFSMFHPTAFGHEQLASEAHRCTTQHMAALASLAPHPEVPVAERKCKVPGEANGVSATAAAPTVAATNGSASFWECTVCTLRNELSETACQACETARPDAPVVALEASKGACELPARVRVRNVKGDVCFEVPCDCTWPAKRLKEAVLAAAPVGFAAPGATCFLAIKGKFLGDGTETLADAGVGDGTQLIAVFRGSVSPAASQPKAFSPPDRT